MIISIVILFGYYFYQNQQDDAEIINFIEAYDQFDTYEKVNDSPLTYLVSKENKTIGYLTFNSENGYQSTISITSLFDMDGKIIDTRTFKEDETPAFFNRIEELGFFEKSFNNKEIENGFKVGVNVDAITRATITSKAITRAVHKSSEFVGKNYLNTKVQNLYGKLKFGLVEAAIVIIFLLVITAYKTKTKNLRIVILIYSIIFLGFQFSEFLSYSMLFGAVTGKWPSIIDDLRWYLLVIGAIGINLISGKNLYCAYICPFGAIQELEYKTAKLKFFRISPRFNKALRILPGVTAYFALITALLTSKIKAMSYEPFPLLYGRLGQDIQWILLPLILFVSLFVLRFYCNYGCPVGYALDLMLTTSKKLERLWKRK